MSTRTFSVDGMSCGGCEANVTDAVSELAGVESVEADHERGRVEVEGTDSVASTAIVEAIQAAGYEVDA